ncbi:MAG TPA: (2Fe-2S)-binding protein [Myxococcales bacterium]|jgi:carbon-monoxide dehydrogenase small subunit|nr:(2Fe-2S)-binding protein [Myxococcales bacterium]HIM01050.1 (2Fe-2S)-binding protein [Myxococcales bacterium]
MSTTKQIRVTINGQVHEANVEPRMLLTDFLRHEIFLGGVHVGCEHGVCGVCTILMDGKAVRSCLTLAVQADGHEIVTIEGISNDAELHPIQQAFIEEYGLQCGFCTPGFVMAIYELLRDTPKPTEEQIMDVIGGVLCRCTGYEGIRRAVTSAIKKLQAQGAGA